MRHGAKARCSEAVIDPIARTMKTAPIWDGASEFPVLDPRFEGCAAIAKTSSSRASATDRRALARFDL